MYCNRRLITIRFYDFRGFNVSMCIINLSNQMARNQIYIRITECPTLMVVNVVCKYLTDIATDNVIFINDL